MAANKKISAEDKEKARFVTPVARLSYPHLFKAQAMPGTQNKPKYSATLLLDKDEDLSVMKSAINQAKKNYFGEKKNWPKKIASPVSDGDDEKYEDNDGYAGCWVIKPSSNEDSKPVVVDKHGKDVLEASKAYPGMYVQCACYAYVWEFPKDSGKYGVGLILDGVKLVKDGEPFSARKSASEMFGMSADDSDDEEEEEEEEADEDTIPF